jgi:hypothetical protein
MLYQSNIHDWPLWATAHSTNNILRDADEEATHHDAQEREAYRFVFRYVRDAHSSQERLYKRNRKNSTA